MTFHRFAIYDYLTSASARSFGYVKEIVVTKKPYAESRKYSISGVPIVDRIGTSNRRILTVHILLCSTADMQFLESHRDSEIKCAFIEDGRTVTMNGFITSDIVRNTPIYAYEDMEQDVYYPDVTLTIEEA